MALRHLFSAAAVASVAVISTAAAVSAASAPSTTSTSAARATPGPGRVAYLARGAAFVEPFLGGNATKLPLSAKATWVSLAASGRVVYGGTTGVHSSDPPYRSAKAISLPPAAGRPLSGYLTSTGKQLALQITDGTALLDLVSGKYTVLPFDALSGDAAVRAYSGRAPGGENDLLLETAAAAPPRPVFTVVDRDRVFAALRSQGSAAAVKIADEHQVDPAPEATHWLAGPPALSPDGEALYWTTNLGGGYGAAGNTEWLIMKTDVASGRTIALARKGTEFGRMPSLRVSPDGRKLLATWSIHSSAVENPTANDVIDLASQKVVHLSNRGAKPNYVNIQDGECWAADSLHMAYSGFYYDPNTIEPGTDPKPERFTLFLKDTVTNQTLRSIDGATGPSCA